MELFELAKAIEAQLFGSREDLDHHPFFGAHPDLLGRLVSKMAYCVREAPVQYIAVDMSQTAEFGSFTIAVYTDDHLFHLSYDPAVDHITTTITGRRALQLVEVLSAPNFMRGERPGTYRGGVQVVASYPTVKVNLPGDNRASEQNRERLDAFLPELLQDLTVS